MVNFMLVSAELQVGFQIDSDYSLEYEFTRVDREFDEWLALQKAKNSSEISDPLTFKILSMLCKKVDELSNLIKNEKKKELEYAETVTQIGYEGFSFQRDCLEIAEIYFAKITLPLFLKRDIFLYFEALDKRVAKIVRISLADEKDWDYYVASKERLEIRKQKSEH